MAVPEQTPYKEYTANGITKIFPLEFDVLEQDHLIVLVNDLEPSVGSWSLDALNDTVVFALPPANGANIKIRRDTPVLRTCDYASYDNSFRPDSINDDFDKIILILQEKGYTDKKLINDLANEIYERSLQNSELKNQIETHTLSLNTIHAIQQDETSKRIEGDKSVALNAKEYTDFMVTMNNTNPSIFSGIADNVVITGTGESQQQLNKKTNYFVESIDALPTILFPENGQTVYVQSYYKGLNKGCSYRIFDKDRSDENDGFLCINGWVLQIQNNTVTPEQAGAKGDGETDDYEAFTRLLRGTQVDQSKGLKIQLNKAVYVTTKPIEMYAGTHIKGCGYSNTKILKKTNSKTGITGRTDPFNEPFDYNVDCAIVFAPWNGWYGDISLEDFKIQKDTVNEGDVGYCLYMPFAMQSVLKNIECVGGEYGIWCKDVWMINWIRVTVRAKGGWYIGTGTSHTMHSCWVTNVLQGYSAYRFHSMTYSTMISCGADYIGLEGQPADAVYHFTGSDITLIGCAAEVVHAYNLVRCDFSWVTIVSPSFRYNIHNNYNNNNYRGLFNVTHADSVLKLIGGRIDIYTGNTPTDAIYVHDGSLSYDQVLWSGIKFPNEISVSPGSKINYGNDAAILNLQDFSGKIYQKSRTKNQPSVFEGIYTKGIVGNGGDIDFNNASSYGGFSRNAGSEGYYGAGFSVGSENLVLQMVSDYNSVGLLKFRTSNANSGSLVFSPWWSVLNSGNTTVTADGTIKKASPIVKLFSDHIECNYEAENQNPSFEKVDVGHYLIKNTLGFAKEGWWIEVPTDTNGNRICAVEYQTLENGDIEVKTFKRKFDVETASIIADEENPMDIPDNMNNEQRWIDLRLHESIKEEDVIVD